MIITTLNINICTLQINFELSIFNLTMRILFKLISLEKSLVLLDLIKIIQLKVKERKLMIYLCFYWFI